MEGLIFGGAYVRREFCVSKSIGLACSGKEIYPFCFVLLCIRGQIPSTSPPRAYVRRGYLTEGFLRYDYGGFIFGGDYTWRGLFSEFYGIIITIIIHFIIKMIKMIIIVIVVLIIIKIIIIITFCSSSGGTHQIYVTACSRVDISSYSTEVCLCENQQDCRCKQRD